LLKHPLHVTAGVSRERGLRIESERESGCTDERVGAHGELGA
jgi:hypothetical protein